MLSNTGARWSSGIKRPSDQVRKQHSSLTIRSHENSVIWTVDWLCKHSPTWEMSMSVCGCVCVSSSKWSLLQLWCNEWPWVNLSTISCGLRVTAYAIYFSSSTRTKKWEGKWLLLSLFFSSSLLFLSFSLFLPHSESTEWHFTCNSLCFRIFHLTTNWMCDRLLRLSHLH